MHIAAGCVAEHGWFVQEVLEHEAVTREDMEGEYLQYFEQALTDAEVFLYEIDEDDTEGTADVQ